MRAAIRPPFNSDLQIRLARFGSRWNLVANLDIFTHVFLIIRMCVTKLFLSLFNLSLNLPLGSQLQVQPPSSAIVLIFFAELFIIL